jgi:hypothetical protein
MKEKLVNQHKRLAMGDTVKGYAKGGSIGVNINATPIGAGRLVPKPSGRSMSPLEVAKRNNGVPGMKTGGSTDRGYKTGGGLKK